MLFFHFIFHWYFFTDISICCFAHRILSLFQTGMLFTQSSSRFDSTPCPHLLEKAHSEFLCLLHRHPIKPQQKPGRCYCTINLSLHLILPGFENKTTQSCSCRLLSHLCSCNNLHKNTLNKLSSHSWASWGIIYQPSLWQWKFTAYTVQFGATVFHSACVFNSHDYIGLVYIRPFS